MENKEREAIETLKMHMKKFVRYPKYKESVDLAIKALEINQKRLELIEKYVLTRDMFEYASANYRYWYDLIDALEACEDD